MYRRQKWALEAAVATLLIAGSARGATLEWDASGNNPISPQPGSGNWDTTNANWSNGTTDVPWINGSTAVFPFDSNSDTVTIVDSSGTVDVAEINFEGPNYTVGANAGDSLTMTTPGGAFLHTGTVSAPISSTNTFGISCALGTLTLSGHSTYSGLTQIGDDTLLLANGALPRS